MSEVIVKHEDLMAIAEAIRTKNESSTVYKPAEMGPAILNLFTERSIKRLEYIEVTKKPKYQFIVNEYFSLDNLEVTAYYSDGTSDIVTDGVTSNIEVGTLLYAEKDLEVILTYYEEGITRTTSYIAYVTDLEIADWTNGTEAQITTMVAAADKGRINLHDYWSIGQKRRVTVKDIGPDLYLFYESNGIPMHNVPVDLILVDYGENYTLTNPTTTRTTGNFIVQYRFVLPFNSAIAVRYNQEEWIWNYTFKSSLLDEWLNVGLAEDPFIQAQPAFFKSILKTVNVPFVKSYDSDEYDYGARQVFLPGEVEVFGRAVHTNKSEENILHQWTYYAIDTDNIKRYRATSSGISDEPVAHWLRSPCLYTGDQTGAYTDGWYWCTVNEEGKAYAGTVKEKSGVLPCFVI